jgi:DNA-binding transcriptional LysR family regulator
LLEQLATGQLDLAVTSAGSAAGIFGWERLRDEELYLQVYAGHRLAKRTA